MLYFHKGDLLNSNYQYICHQVNCMGKMNSGIAKVIREKWPIVYEKYDEECNSYHAWASATFEKEPANEAAKVMLGHAQIVPIKKTGQCIINMFAQANYGYDNRRYTSYDAFWMCLGDIKRQIPKGSEIAFPDHIGCCRGGANWGVILTMIDEALADDYEVHIYKLEENSDG